MRLFMLYADILKIDMVDSHIDFSARRYKPISRIN